MVWLIEMLATAEAINVELTYAAGDLADTIRPHYPSLRQSNRSANTKWTQTSEAKRARALAVAMMTSLLKTFPQDSSARIFDCESQWREIVKRLQYLGLLSPDTAATDVDVAKIVYDAREYLRTVNRVIAEIEARRKTEA